MTALRPDLLLVQHDSGHDHNRKRKKPQAFGNTAKVYMVEVGYCADTKYEEKLQDKMAPHRTLHDLLQARGHKAIYVPIVLVARTLDIMQSWQRRTSSMRSYEVCSQREEVRSHICLSFWGPWDLHITQQPGPCSRL